MSLDFSWSNREKQVCRAVFERASIAEAAELLAGFKARIAVIDDLADLWAIQAEIRESERDFQRKYDFRYSQMIYVFGRLVKEGRVGLEELEGLNEEKLSLIKRFASM